MIRRFLDWTTLTYSPSLMMLAAVGEPDAMAYRDAWRTRREKAKRLPIIGRFMRTWEAQP